MIVFLKKVISYLLIASFFLMDVASCMEPEVVPHPPSTPPIRKSPPPQSPEPGSKIRIQTEGSPNHSPSSGSPSSGLPAGSSKEESPPRGTTGTSGKDSPPTQGVSSAPGRLQGKPASNPRDIPQRGSSLPNTRRSSLKSEAVVPQSPEKPVLYVPTPPKGNPVDGRDVDLPNLFALENAKKAQLKEPLLGDQNGVNGRGMGEASEEFQGDVEAQGDNPYGSYNFEDLLGRIRQHGSPSTRQFLGQLKHQVIDGKLTRWQKASILPALYIGVGTGLAASPVFLDSLFDLNPYFNNQIEGSTSLAMSLGSVIIITQGLDAIPRNTSVFVRWRAPSKKAFLMAKDTSHRWAVRGAKAFVYLGSTVVGVLPFYYFYDTESERWNKAPNYHIDPMPFKLYFAFNVGPYVINAIVLNGDSLGEDAEKALDEYFYTKVRLSDRDLERRRKDLLQGFEEGERLVDALALPTCCCYCEESSPCSCEGEFEGEGFKENRKILRKVYDTVYGRQFKRTSATKNVTSAEIQQAEALRVLLILQTFHQRHKHQLFPEDLQEGTQQWASRMAWVNTLLSTAGRAYILWWVIDQFLGNTGAAVVLGSLLANGALGLAEWKSMKEFFFNLLGGKTLQGARSHPWVRRGLNFVNYSILGPFYTLPYALLGIKATEGWPAEARLSVLLFYCYADSFRNARTFRKPYGDIVTGFDRLKATCGAPSEEYMRDKLKEIQRGYWGDIYLMSHPDLRNLLRMVDERDPERALSHKGPKRDSSPASTKGVLSVKRQESKDGKLSLIAPSSVLFLTNGHHLSNEHRAAPAMELEKVPLVTKKGSSPSCGRITFTLACQLMYCLFWGWLLSEILW